MHERKMNGTQSRLIIRCLQSTTTVPQRRHALAQSSSTNQKWNSAYRLHLATQWQTAGWDFTALSHKKAISCLFKVTI